MHLAVVVLSELALLATASGRAVIASFDSVSEVSIAVLAAQCAAGDCFAACDGGLSILAFAGFFGGRWAIFVVAVFLQQPPDEACRVCGVGGDPAAQADVVAQQLVEVCGGPAVCCWFRQDGCPPLGGAFGDPVRRFGGLEPPMGQQ